MRGYGLLALTFVSCALGFWIMRAISDTDSGESVSEPSVVAFVRNASWNTEYATDVPYQKGDELQYYYIVRSGSRQRAKFDLTVLRSAFDVRSVSVDGVELSADDTADLSAVSTIRMDVVAKAASATDAPDPTDWLVYSAIADLPPEDTVSSGALAASVSGTSNLPDHPSIALSENEAPLGADEVLDPRIDHLLRLSGDDISRATSISVGDRRVPVRTVGEDRFVVLPARDFAPGAYFVVLEYDGRFLRPTDVSLRFADFPDRSVEIYAITPDVAPNDRAANIVLQGRGFDRVVSLQLNNTYILKSTEFTRINDRVMVVEVPEGLDPGEYFLNIMLPNEIV